MALTLDGTTGISATGNIISSAGIISATGNIYGGNIIGTLVVSTATFSGNVTGGNLLTGGLVSATSTITSAANITGGNILTAGLISAAGAITTGGDHSLTGNIVDTGTLWINTLANGNINLNVNGTGQTNIPTGILSVTGNIQGGNLRTAGIVSATGNITGSYILGNGSQLTGVDATQIINGTSNAKVVSSGGNIAVGIGGTANVVVWATTGEYVTGVVSATGAITGAAITGTSLTVSTGNINGGNINNTNANGVGNIGNSTVYFNTVFGKATTAQYADLAELYSADAKYDPGTVLVFGGNNEVTVSTVSADPRVAGVVSTNPAHLMNSVLESEHKVAVALTGRVPTQVTGTVRKGDMMVTAGNGYAQASAAPAMGTVIGKALENFDGASGTIEVVVGRL